MYLTNQLFSAIETISTKRNEIIKNGTIVPNYKVYEKKNDENIIFTCFDICSKQITTNNIIINQFKYEGELFFKINEKTNEITISKLPCVTLGKEKIPVLTSDIATIIIEQTKKIIDPKDIIIKSINSNHFFAIDNNTEKIIPQIDKKEIYILIKKIISKIKEEVEYIKKEVLKEKQRNDRINKKKEMIYSKKKELYGLNSDNYDNNQEFLDELKQKILKYSNKTKEKIERHINLSKEKYLKLLEEDYIEDPLKILKEDLDDTKKDSIISIILENSNLKEVQAETKEEYNPYSGEYEFQTKFYFRSIYEDYCYFLKKDIIVKQSHEHEFFANNSPYSKAFSQGVNLLHQIYTLEKKLDYYNKILENPQKIVLNFQKNSDLIGNIYQFPYFLKYGRDIYHQNETVENPSQYNLLMIKPGVTKINFDDIPQFTTRYGKEFAKRKSEQLKIRKDIAEGKKDYQSCSRLITMIPNSIGYNELLKIIDWSIKKAYHTNFICETPDLKAQVKRIIVLKELAAFKNDKDYLRGNCFVNVDPDYYRSYFVNTKKNKYLWHQYDYHSNYKYRRKNKESLTVQIYYHLAKNYNEKLNSFDYKKIEEELLGSYSSLDHIEIENNYSEYIELTQEGLWYCPYKPQDEWKFLYNKIYEENKSKQKVYHL